MLRRSHFLSVISFQNSFFVRGAILLGALNFSNGANAQNATNTATKPVPVPPGAPIAAPTAPAIKILLLAIDELPAPGATAPFKPAIPNGIVPNGIVPNGVAPQATVPQAIVPVNPPAIAPIDYEAHLRPLWIGQAQKKPKDDKDADLFRLEPEPGLALPKKNREATDVPLPAPEAPIPFIPFTGAPLNTTPLPGDTMGRARLAALPLRNALLGFGWRDVALATPGSSLVTDAVSERRLTPRTLESLKAALSQLAAPGAALSPGATRRAAQSATRIGQALGYRAVAAFYVSPASLQEGSQVASFSLVVADSARESGEPILFDERGATETELRQASAFTAAALLDRTLRTWPDVLPQSKIQLASTHVAAARVLLAEGDALAAQDELNQAVALDGGKSEPFVLLGDLLAAKDPVGAAQAYRRAVEIDARDGATLAKIAVAYTSGVIPDWPRALDAGRKAIATGFDSAALRVAMATAQFGRADLFRKAERAERADDAELDARKHLDRALELAPDDPVAVRLLARQLVASRRFSEAVQTLESIAPRYPNDLEIQTQYALALGGQAGREEDAFVAYGRVWKLSKARKVDVDAAVYRSLSRGFDSRLYNLGKGAVQLTTGVANATLLREDALIQLIRLKENMDEAENAIDILRPASSVAPDGPAARKFAASLMNQSLEQQQYFLETGVAQARVRAKQLFDQAVAQLNSARTRG